MADDIAALAEQVYTPEARPLPPAIALAPSAFIFTGEDALRLTIHNSKTGVVVAVAYRQHAPDGEIPASQVFATPTSDRQPSTHEFPIGRGHLLNVTIYAASGAPKRGQTFVRLQVIRGRGGAATVLGTIVQGYVTGNQDRAWPGSPLEGSLEGDGYSRAVAGTDPAAGVAIAETVPTGARWRVNTIASDLATSGTAGNRYPYASLTYAGVGDGLYSIHPATIAASAVVGVSFGRGMAQSVVLNGNLGCGALPDAVLLAGDVINVGAAGFQAGDNWGRPALNITEWLEAQ